MSKKHPNAPMMAPLQAVEDMPRNLPAGYSVYEVEYAVEREERYRVAAPDAKTAAVLAFSEGQFIDMGEITDVSTVTVTKIATN